MKRAFGHIAGEPVGSTYVDRWSLHLSGVHRPTQAGISGSQKEGADSIVVSGGYEDDADFGHRVIYTGFGGNDPETAKQVADQALKNQNLALVVSFEGQKPVRVVRGSGGDARYSPRTGYRYDGLFRVSRYWHETGRSGFRVWRYELVRFDDQDAFPWQNHRPKPATSPDRDLPLSAVRQPDADTFICALCRSRKSRAETSTRPGVCSSCRP